MKLDGDQLLVAICEPVSATKLVAWQRDGGETDSSDYWVAEGMGDFRVGDVVIVGDPPDGFYTVETSTKSNANDETFGLVIVDDDGVSWNAGAKVANLRADKWFTEKGEYRDDACATED